MPTRLHLTIGEVLSLLREEFPDVSISKLRFLESQGLVDPERTPSGYRKFYDHDVERLRWILLQQKENFLPLKVIRDRLDTDPAPDTPAPPPEASSAVAPEASAPATPVASAPAAPVAEVPPVAAPAPAPSVAPDAPTAAAAPPPAPISGALPTETVGTSPQINPDPPSAPTAPGAEDGRDAYTAAELAERAGCTPELIRDLEEFGILRAGATVGGVAYFDRGALGMARIGARFAELGVEPRHLRPWRNAAEREAGLFEQLVLPLLRQRNPAARQAAADRLTELIGLGGALREGLVAEAARAIG